MSVQKNYVHTGLHTVGVGVLPSRSRLPRFLSWFARRHKENSSSAMAMDFTHGKERAAENGYYQVSVEQMEHERAIDIQGLSLQLIKRVG